LTCAAIAKTIGSGFANGHINGALAGWAGTMVIMVMADWFLPFIYNVGFSGFQAIVLVSI